MTKRERRTFTEEFKQQMVQLYQNGKPRKEIIREYDLTPSSLDKWVKQSQSTGSFKEKDNLTDEQKEVNYLPSSASQKPNMRLCQRLLFSVYIILTLDAHILYLEP